MSFQRMESNSGGRVILIVIGGIIYGFSLGMILSPCSIAPGGVSGISVILASFTSIGVGTFALLLNIPLLVLGIVKFGVRFFSWTLLSIGVGSASADIFSTLVPLTKDPLIAAISGGALMGIGVGLVFRGGATTGGSDIVTKLIFGEGFKQKINEDF